MNNKLDITYVNDKTNIQNVSGYGTQIKYHGFKPWDTNRIQHPWVTNWVSHVPCVNISKHVPCLDK